MVLGNFVGSLMVGSNLSHIAYTHFINDPGHAGHDTVDYVSRTLPDIINSTLSLALENSNTNTLTPLAISDILTHSIQSLDNRLTRELLRLFPDPSFIAQLSDDEISATVNDVESGGANSEIVARCMRGSTILVSLVDPPGSNLWVASLGDSQAGDVSNVTNTGHHQFTQL